MTQAANPKVEHPWLRQLTGVSVKTENVIQHELDALGVDFSKIAAKSGDPEIDREIYKRMGPIVELQLGRYIESPAYQRMDNPEMKRFVLTAALSYVRSQATQMLKQERPDLEQKMKLEQVPKAVKDLLISIGLPDLDKILSGTPKERSSVETGTMVAQADRVLTPEQKKIKDQTDLRNLLERRRA